MSPDAKRLVRLIVENHTPTELAIGWLKYQVLMRNGVDEDWMLPAIKASELDAMICRSLAKHKRSRVANTGDLAMSA